MKQEYKCTIRVNLRNISSVIIDQHYKKKHPEITDSIIIELVRLIDGMNFSPGQISDDFEYFKVEPIMYQDKPYRLIFLLPKTGNYFGVINAFRVRRKK